MAAAVAGEVLGPRPGKAICTFCGGRVEILLRVLAPVVRQIAITSLEGSLQSVAS